MSAFIGPHTSEERPSPFSAWCVVRLWGLVVVLPSIHPLHVICALLLVSPFGRGGRSPFLDMMAVVFGCACLSRRCHSCMSFVWRSSCCRCVSFPLLFSCWEFFVGPEYGMPLLCVDFLLRVVRLFVAQWVLFLSCDFYCCMYVRLWLGMSVCLRICTVLVSTCL